MTAPADTTEVTDRLDRIEAMLEEVLARVPDGTLGWSRSTPELRLIQNRKREERYRKDREAEAVWRRLPPAGRESLVLQVLGDERLIIPELVLRLNAELGYPAGKGPEKASTAVHGEHVRRLVTRMYRDGYLDRVAEPAPGCKIRHRYFRQQALEGPIADLERTYQEGGE